eukprot:scaffold2563_cov124-Cylindrotheca_fusiformis.AAC.14
MMRVRFQLPLASYLGRPDNNKNLDLDTPERIVDSDDFKQGKKDSKDYDYDVKILTREPTFEPIPTLHSASTVPSPSPSPSPTALSQPSDTPSTVAADARALHLM